jgi:hypothetical protein
MIRHTICMLILTAAIIPAKAQSTQDLVKKNMDLMSIAIPSAKSEPGIGENDGTPSTTPFKLPPGFRFVQNPDKPFDPDIKKLRGVINTFYVDVHIEVNREIIKKDGPTIITFPEGLVVLNIAPSRLQNGMLMDREPVTVPPGGIGAEGKDTFTVYLGVACLNEGSALPWEENIQGPDDIKNYPIGKGMYKPIGVTTHKGLLELARLLSQYPKLKLKQHYNPHLQFNDDYVQPEWLKIYGRIQEMVWKVTEGGGITKGELEKFKGELAAYK